MEQTAQIGFDVTSGVVGAYSAPTGSMILIEPVAKDAPLSAYAEAFLRGEPLAIASPLGGPERPFVQQWTVYRCISKLAEAIAGIPLKISRGPAAGTRAVAGHKYVRIGAVRDRQVCQVKSAEAAIKAVEGQIVEAGPLFDLLRQPNAEQTWPEFAAEVIGLTYLDGRSHWLFDEMVGRRPITMWPAGGDLSDPVVNKSRIGDRLIGWRIRGSDGIEYAWVLDELLTIHHFNPGNRHKGLSPLEPGRLAIVSEYNAATYNAAMFGNSGEPGGVLKTDAEFDPVKDAQIRTTWRQRHGGAGRAKSVAVLWGGMTWESVASTMANMQFTEGERLMARQICSVLGVDEVVIGLYTDANYQFAEQGRMNFWQDTVMPLAQRLAETINVHLAPRFGGGLEVWFDVEAVPIVQKMRLSRLDAVEKLWPKGVPLQDLDDLYDLGVPRRPWHEIGYLPAGLLPAGEVASGGGVPNVPEGTSAPGNDELDQGRGRATGTREQGPGKSEIRNPQSEIEKAALDRLWADWERSWRPLAKSVQSFLRQHFMAQRRRLLAALGAENPKSEIRNPNYKLDDSVIARLLVEISPSPQDSARFRARIRAFVTTAKEIGLRQALAQAGLTGDALEAALRRLMTVPAITDAVASEANKISTKIDVRTRQVLRASLTEGVGAGEDIRQLADRVQEVMGNRRAEAFGIARNAVTGSLSQAHFEGARASGLSWKLWVYSRGPGVRRDAHVEAEARYAAAPIRLDEPFEINGVRLMYPRDWSCGAAEETVNCCCMMTCRAAQPAGRPAAAAMIDWALKTWRRAA